MEVDRKVKEGRERKEGRKEGKGRKEGREGGGLIAMRPEPVMPRAPSSATLISNNCMFLMPERTRRRSMRSIRLRSTTAFYSKKGDKFEKKMCNFILKNVHEDIEG